MKVHVDPDRCKGHSVCCVVCPEVFSLNDAGYSEAIVDEVPAALEEDVREAAHACPEHAIVTS